MLFVDSDMESEDNSDQENGSISEELESDQEMEEETVADDNSDEETQENGDVSDEDPAEDCDDPTEENISKDGKKKRKRKNRKEKVSNSEARQLHDKEHTYSSNMYRIQIEEILTEISIPEKHRKEVQNWFSDFKSFVMGCKPSKEHQISDLEQVLKGVLLPLPNCIRASDDSAEMLRWTPPSEISMIGSWESNSAIDKISCVDVAVEIPLKYLRKKDFLNHRYHLKRAIYLSYIAKLLLKRGETVYFTCQQGHPTKPAVIVDCKHFSVKIIASLPEVFKINRFAPDVNNLRFEHFFQQTLQKDEPLVATPNYNFTILSDLLLLESQTLIHKVIHDNQCFQNAVKLVKVWLKQRGLDKGFGGFTGFIASAFVVYLFSKELITTFMSTYDVIRIFFSNLSKLDLTTQGISLSTGVSFNDWHLQFDVVFLDFNGVLNYTSDMSKFTYKRVQLEAQLAAEMLESNKTASFNTLFLTIVPFIHNFDHVLQLPESVVTELLKNGNKEQFLNHSGYYYPVAVSVLGQLIETCLGDRLKFLDHELIPERRWELHEAIPNISSDTLNFGFVINRERAYKLVEKCDTEDAKRAEAFKNFWGDKSQLRRFKDGTMCETVVFESNKKTMFQMISYIFLKHLSAKSESLNMQYIDTQIEDVIEKQLIMIKKLNKPKQTKFIKGKRKKPSRNDFQDFIFCELDTISITASQVFDDLSKVLRALEGLPLEVSTVQGISPILRFAEVCPTPPQTFQKCKWLTQANPKQRMLTIEESSKDGNDILPKIPKLVNPVEVLLHLETSGKWPDDVAAVDRLKCAFLMRIGKLLNDQFGLIIHPSPNHLDVLKDGFVFRIKLTYYRELTLLKQHLGADGVLKMRDCPESLKLEKETILLPQLTTTLHSFHQLYPAFGKTCRLAKRWMASQLLLGSPLKYNTNSEQPDCRFSEESIELLVSYIFMSFSPYLSPPNEAQVGFLRFLLLLSNCDWKSTPIILNFNEKLSAKDISAIELDFVKRRHQLPPMFLASPEEKVASVWTKHLAPILLYRAQLLAKEALSVLQSTLTDSMKQDHFTKNVKMLFRPDYNGFDLIIHLKKLMNPRSDSVTGSNAFHYHEYAKSINEVIPIIDFDPIQLFLSELQSTFGHLAIFLHNTYGGKFIAVVWKPDSFKEQNFAVSSINTRRVIGGCKIATSIEEVLESIEIIGNGLIESIEMKRDISC